MAFLRRGGLGHQFIVNYLFCLEELTILQFLFPMYVNKTIIMDVSLLNV
jgi:hypothetical protein